jgi:predicted ArsR family transcriptional regulator
VIGSESRVADPVDTVALGESRARVLSALQSARSALGVTDIASRVGLHPNTARFHLDALVGQGLARRSTEDRDGPGRPRTLYAATEDSARTGKRSYRLLAEILSSYLATHAEHPSQAASEAGEAWGRFLAERPAPFQQVDPVAATEQLTQLLEQIGFAPEPTTTEHERRILLHHCPFREAAEENRDVVCAVHLGLMRGVLAELDAPVEVLDLEPFVEPNVCITHLATRGPARRSRRNRL